MKRADLGIGLYVLSAIIFLIIPMPSFLLDFLLAINMSVALIILFNTIYAADTLQMSSFPTVLLLTTIFRIGLNASSTRLILTTGDPGQVVLTFGRPHAYLRKYGVCWAGRSCRRGNHIHYYSDCPVYGY